ISTSPGSGHVHDQSTTPPIDIIANNPIDQKVVELCSSQHYALVEHAMYRSVFPPQGVEDGVFLPSSPRLSEAFAGYDESDACGIWVLESRGAESRVKTQHHITQ